MKVEAKPQVVAEKEKEKKEEKVEELGEKNETLNIVGTIENTESKKAA